MLKLTRCPRRLPAACLTALIALAAAPPAFAQLGGKDDEATGGKAEEAHGGKRPPEANGGTTPAPAGPPAAAIEGPPAAAVPVPTAGYVFPIRGRHSFGAAINRFGAGRGDHAHRGHDVFAAAGTPVVAARGGRVTHRAFQAAAGHYVVIETDDGTDHVYMHLQSPGTVTPGQTVQTGQPIGRVGCTGRCSGPHLHFEVWVGRWYGGGRPIDPLPRLRAWDAIS